MMFAGGIAPAVLFGLLLLCLPESPRWLMERRRYEQACQTLMPVVMLLPSRKWPAFTRRWPRSRALWAEVFRQAPAAFLFIGIALAILQQVTGINVFLYFGATIFRNMSESHWRRCWLLQQIINGACMLFTVIAIATVDRWGGGH